MNEEDLDEGGQRCQCHCDNQRYNNLVRYPAETGDRMGRHTKATVRMATFRGRVDMNRSQAAGKEH